MPNTRKKLIELLETLFCSATALDLADYLIANGVTTADDRPRFFIKRNHMGQEELEQIIGSGPVILSVGEDSIIPIHPGRWIPVAERLPEPRVWVLCAGKYTDDLHILRRRSSRKDESWEAQVGEGYYSDLITHWMPLPEPPEGE